MNELAAPQWVPQRRPPEWFRGVAFCHRVYPTSPLEHGRDYYCDLFPVSQRLVALEPRRVICVHSPILWWVESLPNVSLPIWSPFVGLGVIRFSTPSLSHLPRPWPSFVADQPPSTFAPGPPLPPSGPSSRIMAPRSLSSPFFRRLPFHFICGCFLGFRFRVGAGIPRTTNWNRIWSGMDLRVA